MAEPRGVGPGRLLAAGYAVFVVAAAGRTAVQLAAAPRVIHVRGIIATVAYAVGLALLVRAERGRSRRAATAWCALELGGVVAAGTWTVVDPSAFPDATVWSGYGAGYGFVPLLLPILALAWLRRAHPARPATMETCRR